MGLLQTVKALRCEGISKPWRMAFAVHVKHRFLPHRTYFRMDRDGHFFNPPLLQWNLGPWRIWQSRKPKAAA
jgi:hypothetical protein